MSNKPHGKNYKKQAGKQLTPSIGEKPKAYEHKDEPKTTDEGPAKASGFWRRVATAYRKSLGWIFRADSNHVIAVATVVAACATGWYAFVATGQMKIMSDQLKQMESSKRPWLGVDGSIVLIQPPSFEVNMTSISVRVVGQIVIKNFGASPAFKAQATVTPELAFGVQESVHRPSAARITCSDTAPEAGGEVTFPGSSFRRIFNQTMASAGRSPERSEAFNVWLTGCISYRDDGDAIHKTIFWFRSASPDAEAWVKVVPTFGNHQFRYRPIAGFESWGQEAN